MDWKGLINFLGFLESGFPSLKFLLVSFLLTHWGRVTHIYVNKLTIIGSDNGLSPGRRQAIIWTNAAILLIEPLETNFSEILIEIQTFSFKKMHLKMSSGKWRPSCLGLNELTPNIPCFFYWQNNVIQNGRRDSTKYHSISSVTGLLDLLSGEYADIRLHSGLEGLTHLGLNK